MSSSEEDEFDTVEGTGEDETEDEFDAPLVARSGSDEEEEEEEEEQADADSEEWTDDQLKLLYLISRYATQAATAEDEETWIRKNSLLVLMYKGIVDQVLDYDYAPISLLVGRKRMWLNVTQEGKDDIDDLRAGGLLNALKLSSEELQPVTAYQVSAAGLKIVPMIPKDLTEAVDKCIEHEGEPLEVHFDMREGQKDEEGEDLGPCFWLRGPGEHQEESGITETEDVSYVASPYLPACLRGFGPQCKDNSSRAHEAAEGESQLKDELDAQIILKDLTVLVGEWIPFGANQIVAINEKLGAADRCQGGLFTGELDTDPTATSFEVPAGLTAVKVLDYNEVKYINIEAQINFPEDEGIVQVEEFGMHFDVNGKVVYAMKMEAIMDKLKDDICIDLLARVLVDVHLDSSRITKDLISKYQMSLLETAFMNDAANRDKFNLLITTGIEPKLKEAVDYLDGEDMENELKQVLGDTQGAWNLTKDDILIAGRNGLLVAGPGSKQYEPQLVLYLQLHSRNMFMRVFFTRVFVLGDELRKIRDMIGLAQFAHNRESGGVAVGDPAIVDKVRDRLSLASRDLILMTETMGFMADSLEPSVLTKLPRPKDMGGKELHRILRNDFMITNLQKRVRDLQKNLKGAAKELANLSAMTEVINTKQLEDVYRGVEKNTKKLVDAAAANERSAASLEIMQLVFFASETFGYIDHFFGMVGYGTNDFQQWVLDNLV